MSKESKIVTISPINGEIVFIGIDEASLVLEYTAHNGLGCHRDCMIPLDGVPEYPSMIEQTGKSLTIRCERLKKAYNKRILSVAHCVKHNRDKVVY